MLQTGVINLSPPPHPPSDSYPPRAELLFTFHYLNFLEPRCLKRNPFTYCVSFLNWWRAIVKLNFFRLFIFFLLYSRRVFTRHSPADVCGCTVKSEHFNIRAFGDIVFYLSSFFVFHVLLSNKTNNKFKMFACTTARAMYATRDKNHSRID